MDEKLKTHLAMPLQLNLSIVLPIAKKYNAIISTKFQLLYTTQLSLLNNSTIFTALYLAANINGVQPALFLCSLSELWLRSNSTTSVWPNVQF